jgi:hypothetical protein
VIRPFELSKEQSMRFARLVPISCGLVVALTAMGCAAVVAAQEAGAAAKPAEGAAPVLAAGDLGKGGIALDGLWQFHLGDDPAFARTDVDDATGHGGWEQIAANRGWGSQGHRSHEGYGWYRRHIDFSPGAGKAFDVTLMIPHIDDVYELYWNGVLVGRNGTMPPHPNFPFTQAPQVFHLGALGKGVLAVRVWKAPFGSDDDGQTGGFAAAPVVGGAVAIADHGAALNFRWLQRQQFQFALLLLEVLATLLGFIVWLQNRSQMLLLWLSLHYICGLVGLILLGLRLPLSWPFAFGLWQPFWGLRDVSEWFMLLWLFDLTKHRWAARMTRVVAVIVMVSCVLDAAATYCLIYPDQAAGWAKLTDGILTIPTTAATILPLILVVVGFRRKLDFSSRLVAVFAFSLAFLNDVTVASSQGSRFTHWDIGPKISAPLFTLGGNPFNAVTILRTGLLLSIVYAVYVYLRKAGQRQGAIEREFQNARELQQVLIPEDIPALPGFALASVYRPAQEVGGDFFQVIPMSGDATLVVLGDVSGKGLRAAMAVSLIVGAIRTLAETAAGPAEILAGLNRRLHGRMGDGFATCVAMRLDADGTCTVANAGHIPPYRNGKEIATEYGLPLGPESSVRYAESRLQLAAGDQLTLLTDGVLEAQNNAGELFGFERTAQISAESAETIATAAQAFGQEDDITVLTLTFSGAPVLYA